jgi:hypothetical protein
MQVGLRMVTQANCGDFVRCEVLSTMPMEVRLSFVWEVTPCSLVDRIYYPEIGGGSPPERWYLSTGSRPRRN